MAIGFHSNLGDSDLNKEFQEMWNMKEVNIKDKVLKTAINFMNTKIKAGNKTIFGIRMNWEEEPINWFWPEPN
jgi:hypothetical protein